MTDSIGHADDLPLITIDKNKDRQWLSRYRVCDCVAVRPSAGPPQLQQIMRRRKQRPLRVCPFLDEDEDFQHQDGVEGRPPAAVLPRLWVDGIKSAFGVKIIDGIGDESLQTVFLNPVGDVLREEVLLVLIVSIKL